MARAAFAFVVPDGAQPGGVIQVPVLGILGQVKLPEGTFGGQQLTGTYQSTFLKITWQKCPEIPEMFRRQTPVWGQKKPQTQVVKTVIISL